MTPKPRPAAARTRPLAARYARVRAASLALAAPLSAEDCQVQSMADASPTKWHLAHVTWFFETFLLERFEPGFVPFDPAFRVLFNSYYQGVGEQHPRPQRGLVTRPDARRRQALSRQRRRADAGAARRAAATTPRSRRWSMPRPAARAAAPGAAADRHQARAVASTRSRAAYARRWPMAQVRPQPLRWFGYEGGLVELGHDADARRRVLLRQRDAAPPRLRRAVRARIAARDLRRLPRLHRRRRLPAARALAVDGLGLGRRPARAHGAALLAPRRRPLAASTRCRAWSRSTRTRRSATSATSRPTRSRAGRARACRPSSNGSSRRARCARRVGRQLRRPRRLPSAAADDAGRRRAGADVRRRLGVDAVGLPALSRLPAAAGRRSANTTASSCATSSCCAAARARRRPATCAPATATSSRPRRSGSSAASACARRLRPARRRERAVGCAAARHASGPSAACSAAAVVELSRRGRTRPSDEHAAGDRTGSS